MLLACGEVDVPTEPPGEGFAPVTEAAQLTGLWYGEQVFAGGRTAASWNIPAFMAGRYNARISTWYTNLVITSTSLKTGVFTINVDGTAADTANPFISIYGDFEYWGDIVIGDEGALNVTMRRGDSSGKTFRGTANILADTLVIDFTLAAPPERAVGFLPDTLEFIARLVRQ